MGWSREGTAVSSDELGLYVGTYAWSGVVSESRVKYGGAIQHTVILDAPIVVYGAVREVLLIEERG